jgi:hypothetical protein
VSTPRSALRPRVPLGLTRCPVAAALGLAAITASCAAGRGAAPAPLERVASSGLVASSAVELAAWAERAPLEVLVAEDTRAAVERARRTTWRDAIRLSVDALSVLSPDHVAHAVHVALVVRADVWPRLFGGSVDARAPRDAPRALASAIEPAQPESLAQPQLRARRAALRAVAGEE